MEERLRMIYGSFDDISKDIKQALLENDSELVRSHLFRGHRLVAKTINYCEKNLENRAVSSALDYFRCAKFMKAEISSWYEQIAFSHSEQNLDAEAERELFAAVTESDIKFDRFIQYSHAALKLHNLFVNKDIKETILRVSTSNVKEIVECLKRVRLVLNAAASRHGMREAAGNIMLWCDELGKAIQDKEDLVAALNKEPESISLDQALRELEKLIGLDEVKQKICDITNLVAFNKLRREQGFKTDEVSLHMVFTGNPGTGKTTVARLVAVILKAVGVLSKGHLVEVGRSDLVAEYVGQTAVKTMNKIKEAKGGVLFIDEAYSLVRGSASSDFGIEAIDTLVKAMEDERKNMIVILAGYPREMDSFIESNPGLQSRFKNQIGFKDYTLDELMSITEILLKDRDYHMDAEAYTILRRMVGKIIALYPQTHGNGRLVRNMIEDAIMAKASLAMNQKASNLPIGQLDLLDGEIMLRVESKSSQSEGFKSDLEHDRRIGFMR
ncbi:AAA family ATPase [Bacillus sp. FJAT-18017]|uniref:AAA family ATPase n=1 Tax=Bacillus sp. FJAT-18017 TaxID=1705566 RepID=UPI0006AFD9F5|nr:AAA family ATPase [Bacillus sp. FJAT-18017]